MPLSWNEIRHNAIRFSHDWAGASREDADAKSFWDDFFSVFGIRRRTVASFEAPVKNLAGQYNFIDLFWKGVLLVEHKSRGKDLGKAQSQAFSYIQDLEREGRDDEAPRYIIVSDFARIALHDLEPDKPGDAIIEFPLSDFHTHIHHFAFIPGYKQHVFEDQDPINMQAVAIMGDLHDTLETGGYSGHDLERFLVRILFCLFADDTGIFDRDAFRLYIENHTKPDGSDLGPQLAQLFAVLNTPEDKRQKNLDEDLAAFRYVNGDLFSEQLGFAAFNRDMRTALVRCTRFDWSRISPAIFGSLFQAIMEPRERRQIGGHYTSERDILKVARSLFLDDLRAEFDRIKTNKPDLRRFHQKLGSLVFLDPACGCGNFLVITYRELRVLEIDVLKALHGRQQELDIQHLSIVDVDAFHGMEISEWPARIAEVAMWLMDHLMNLKLSEEFGRYYVRLPLQKSPHIVCGNALRLDWKTVVSPDKCSYILGNPPFVGQHFQTAEQKKEQHLIMANIAAAGVMDYVANWYVKAAEYIGGTSIRVAFVSTNSITQGEQAGILWSELFSRYHVKIQFAHRTFQWESEARGKAHVHVVVVGFGMGNIPNKRIYDYDANPQNPNVIQARNISPYLVEGPDMVLTNRSQPLCPVPRMLWGNKPTDGGNLVLTQEERDKLLAAEPVAARYVRPYMGGQDFINNHKRFCLWLVNVEPSALRQLPLVRERVEAVKKFREASKAASTRNYAKYPTLFRQIAQPDSDYLAVPEVSSEGRNYIPIAFISKDVICSNTVQFVAGASLYHFGLLTSAMHMAWVRQVCGRLKSDYRYSNSLVYNNFPWPESVTDKQRQLIEEKARHVLDTRAQFPGSTLADLYDPLSMPPALVKAHAELDRTVDACYRPQPFTSERQRVEYLFALYEKLTAPLTTATRLTSREDARTRTKAKQSLA